MSNSWWSRLFGTKQNANETKNEKSLEDQRKDLEETIRINRLKKAAKLTESYADTDYWLTAYSDLLARYKDGFALAYPITQPTDRRYGGNFPFWYSEQQLGLIRAQARMITTMSPNAQGLINGLTSYVIGSGYRYDVVAKPDREVPDRVMIKIQDVIDEFCENNAWTELEQELFWRSREDGEFFLRLFSQENGKLMVRVVEPEQVFMPAGGSLFDFSYGIKTDPDDVCNVISYAVSYVAPGGDKDKVENPMATEEVPADQMVHVKVNTKRNIKRGLSDFSYDTLEAFSTAAKLRTNLGEGSAVQAAIAGVRQHDAASSSQVDAFVNAQTDYAQYSPVTQRATDFQQIKSGTFVDIPKGMNFVPPPGAAANAINGHLAVFQSLLRSAGNRHNAPEWLVSADASNNNYASSMTAESPFLRHCKRLQEFYKRPFLRVIKAAIENAIDAGKLPTNLMEFIDITATPPELEVQDKSATAMANQIYAGLGVKSRQTIASEIGLDWDTELTNQQEYTEQMGAASPLPMPGQGQEPGDGPPEAADEPEVGTPAPQAALNGAQVQSLVNLATQVISGEIPMNSALAIAKAAFPGVDAELTASIFHQAVKQAEEPGGVEGLRERIIEAMQVSGEDIGEAERYSHINFTPPKAARDAASRALAARKKKAPSERGMTATGIARARDLVSGKKLSPETIRRMISFFARHEVDKKGESWNSQGKGWQAWNGWGGDAGYAFARKVVRQMDAADAKEAADPAVSDKISKLRKEGYSQKQAVAIALSMSRRGELNEGRWVTMGAKAKAAHNRAEGDEGEKRGGVAVYIDDDGTILKGPAHMTGKKPDEIKKQTQPAQPEPTATTPEPTSEPEPVQQIVGGTKEYAQELLMQISKSKKNSESWHADMSQIKAKPQTTEQMVRNLSGARPFLGFAAQKGIYTDGRIVMIIPDKEKEVYRNAFEKLSNSDKQRNINAIEKWQNTASFYMNKEMDKEIKPVGTRKLEDKFDQIIFQAQDGSSVAINAEYYNTIKKRYPKSTLHTIKDSSSNAILVAQDGKRVGLIMPLTLEDDDKSKDISNILPKKPDELDDVIKNNYEEINKDDPIDFGNVITSNRKKEFSVSLPGIRGNNRGTMKLHIQGIRGQDNAFVVMTDRSGSELSPPITKNMAKQLAATLLRHATSQEYDGQLSFRKKTEPTSTPTPTPEPAKAPEKAPEAPAAKPKEQPAETPKSAKSPKEMKSVGRSKSGQAIKFSKPIVGPSGAKLDAYEWQWTMGEKYSAREEGMVAAKVSDWEKSEASSETGKQVVHQFSVTDADGTSHLVSLEGAARMLGFSPAKTKEFKNVASAVKTLAKNKMILQAKKQDYEYLEKIHEEIEKEVEKMIPPEPEIKEIKREDVVIGGTKLYTQVTRLVMPITDSPYPFKSVDKDNSRWELDQMITQAKGMWKDDRYEELKKTKLPPDHEYHKRRLDGTTLVTKNMEIDDLQRKIKTQEKRVNDLSNKFADESK